jgi:hypothetical protein
MKTKIILTLLLITTLMWDASAMKIVMQGGGRHRLFDYIYIDDKTCVCRGNGNLPCPVNFDMQGSTMTTWVSGKDVTEYVLTQLEKGNYSGEKVFGEDLAVKWNSHDKETVEIDIDNTTIKGIENDKK